jgi:hypothetical protein
MPDLHRLIDLQQTCGACPEQYEGQLEDGRWIYLRHRHGLGNISVGSTVDDAVTAGWPGYKSDGRELLAWRDNEWDGMLRPGALAHIFYLAGIDPSPVADQIATSPNADDFIAAAAELGINLEVQR